LRLAVARVSLRALAPNITHLCLLFGLCACTSTVAGDPAFGSGSSTTGDSTQTENTSGAASAGKPAESGNSTSGGSATTGAPVIYGYGSGDGTGSTIGAASGDETGARSGSSTSGSPTGTSGEAANSGSASGSSSDGPVDAGGEMHRDSAVPVLTGCAAQVPSAIFGASCEARACHNSVDHIYALDLQSPGVVSRLLNQPSYELPALMMIDPKVPDNSFILLKVKPNPPVGVQMPQMGAKLSAAQIQCLQQWVEAVSTGPY
jgi:hypothetical protein